MQTRVVDLSSFRHGKGVPVVVKFMKKSIPQVDIS